MKRLKLLAISICLGIAAGVQADKMIAVEEMARIMEQSVVKLDVGRGHCTASKIGPRQFLTAAHCSRFSAGEARIEYNGYQYLFPSYVTTPTKKKQRGDRSEDWAIIHTSDDSNDIASLKLGCGELLVVGQLVAHLGYSGGLSTTTFSIGRITSVKPPMGPNDADFTIDVQAAPGSSGAPIVSLETGNIIGILVEGVSSPRVGFFLIGVESVNRLPQCERMNERSSDYPVT